jgi:hypothetical protein
MTSDDISAAMSYVISSEVHFWHFSQCNRESTPFQSCLMVFVNVSKISFQFSGLRRLRVRVGILSFSQFGNVFQLLHDRSFQRVI